MRFDGRERLGPQRARGGHELGIAVGGPGHEAFVRRASRRTPPVCAPRWRPRSNSPFPPVEYESAAPIAADRLPAAARRERYGVVGRTVEHGQRVVPTAAVEDCGRVRPRQPERAVLADVYDLEHPQRRVVGGRELVVAGAAEDHHRKGERCLGPAAVVSAIATLTA